MKKMNAQMMMVRTWFGLVSVFNPEKAARMGFRMFQKVRIKGTREREELFFDLARKFKVTFKEEDLSCFEIGDPNGELVFLVHGWESNAGSMTKFALALAENGKRVIAMNLPAHADHKSNYTNLMECKDAFVTLLDYMSPKEPFSVISHSFGSAVVAYGLSKVEYKVDKLVFLTNPNRIDQIFMDFKEHVGIGNRSYRHLLILTHKKLGEPLENLNIENALEQVDFDKLLLIHDFEDTALKYQHSFELNNKFENAQLITLQKVGHYKMLWNDEVVNRTVTFVNGEEVFG